MISEGFWSEWRGSNSRPRGPKPRVLSAELHPDIQFLSLYHGGEENQRFFCLWSFMWSKPLLCRFLQPGEIQQTQASQGFATFRLTPSRIPPRHSQSKRATNCANPGFLVIEFCARCGQTCGQAVFLTISACGGSACIVGVSRDCGHGIFRLEGGATRSQSRRAANCATPGYFVILSGWSYSPKAGTLPAAQPSDIHPACCGALAHLTGPCAAKPCYYTA